MRPNTGDRWRPRLERSSPLRLLILAFETRAARRYGEVVAARERSGRPISTADGQIAAICAAQQATLATRNIGDFDDTGIDVINPWTL